MLAVSFGGRSECGVDGNVERLDLDPKGPTEVPGEDLPVLDMGDLGSMDSPSVFCLGRLPGLGLPSTGHSNVCT